MTTPAVRRVGQPTKLTAARHQVIVDAASVGMSWRAAAQYAGVSPSTIGVWRKWGEEAWAQVVETLATLDDDALAELDALPDIRPPERPYEPTARDLALEQFVDARDRPYLRLFRDCERATAYFELRNLTLIQEAAAGYVEDETTTVTERDAQGRVTKTTTTTRRKPTRSWQAAMTLLERRIPERYAQLSRTEHTGLGGGPIEVDVEHSPGEVLRGLQGDDRDARTAEILRIMADAEILDAEVVDDLLVAPGPNGSGTLGDPLGGDDPETDEVHPDRPDA